MGQIVQDQLISKWGGQAHTLPLLPGIKLDRQDYYYNLSPLFEMVPHLRLPLNLQSSCLSFLKSWDFAISPQSRMDRERAFLPPPSKTDTPPNVVFTQGLTMQPQVAWNSERGLPLSGLKVCNHTLAQSLRSLNKGRWGSFFLFFFFLNTFRFYQAGVGSDYISLIQFY